MSNPVCPVLIGATLAAVVAYWLSRGKDKP